MPLPMRIGTRLLDASFADFASKHWTKSVPPKADRFVTDDDATLMQQILDVAQRERKPDVRHHCEADDLGR
ncbi:secreted protein B [Ahrensia sp. R2A130]|nr:secreted protein B [Ahrensia sp. R2A130]